MDQCGVTDTGLCALTKLSSLFEFRLTLRYPTAVTSDGLQALGALTQLKKLDLSCVCHTEQLVINLAFVRKFKCLRELYFFQESQILDLQV